MIIVGANLIYILFNFFWNWQEWNWTSYLLFYKEFPLIMGIPLTLYLLILGLLKSKTYQQVLVAFQSANNKDRLKIPVDCFLYAESNDNYVSICYKEGDRISTHLIRNTLKNVQLHLAEFENIEQCHRRYVINKLQISKVKEEKGKVFIQIANQTIPISKKYWPHYLG